MTRRRFVVPAVVAVACVVSSGLIVDVAGATGLDTTPVRLAIVGGGDVSDGRLSSLATAAGGALVDESSPPHVQVIEVTAARAALVTSRLQAQSAVRFVEPVSTYRASIAPNDPGWPSQSALAVLNLPAVWDTTTGSSSVVIGVIDSGVNPVGDIAGRVLAGYNVFTQDTNSADDAGHGTEVASVAASGGNDHASVAGICWACRILPVKVLDSNGEGSTVGIAAGMRWATDHGATVLNLSLGGPDLSQVVADAVLYARNHGVVVVAAAGNEGPDGGPDYPAAIPGTLAVAGSDSLNSLDSDSNRGPAYVDVAAPWCTLSGPTGYLTFCGTSAATPIVSGVVALLRSQRPDLGEAAIRRIIDTTATPLDGVRYGHIAPDAAVAIAPSAPNIGLGERDVPGDTEAPTVSLSDPAAVVGGWLAIPIDVSDDRALVSASISVRGVMAMGLPVSGRNARSAVFFDTTRFADGPAPLQIDVTDSSGNVGTRTLSTTIDNTRPVAGLLGPPNGSVVRGSFNVGVSGRDAIGVKAVLVARNLKLIGGFMGAGPGVFRVPVTASGKVDVIVASVDLAGNIGLARTTVTAKVRVR